MYASVSYYLYAPLAFAVIGGLVRLLRRPCLQEPKGSTTRGTRPRDRREWNDHGHFSETPATRFPLSATHRALVCLSALGLIPLTAAQGDEPEPVQLPTIEVTERYDALIGIGDSATAGTVGPKQIESRPILRPGEVLETVPGVIITQHSGAGKANQFFCAVSTSTMAPTSRPRSPGSP